MALSRRGFIGVLAGLTGGFIKAGPAAAIPAAAASAETPAYAIDDSDRLRQALRARLGDDIYTSWFQTLEVERIEAGTVTVSLPVKFLRNWIQSHWPEELLACCRTEFPSAQRVEIVLRRPGTLSERQRREIAVEVQRYRELQARHRND